MNLCLAEPDGKSGFSPKTESIQDFLAGSVSPAAHFKKAQRPGHTSSNKGGDLMENP